MPQKQTDKREGTSKDHDFTIKARNVLEQVIGEHLDGTPLEDANKNEKLVARARKAGKVGGKARAKKLSAKRRAEIAKRAAKARWNKK